MTSFFRAVQDNFGHDVLRPWVAERFCVVAADVNLGAACIFETKWLRMRRLFETENDGSCGDALARYQGIDVCSLQSKSSQRFGNMRSIEIRFKDN